MRLLWFFVFLLALVGGGAFGETSTCPAKFEPQEGKCVAPRPVHGTCPEGSTYSANLNLCVAN